MESLLLPGLGGNSLEKELSSRSGVHVRKESIDSSLSPTLIEKGDCQNIILKNVLRDTSTYE